MLSYQEQVDVPHYNKIHNTVSSGRLSPYYWIDLTIDSVNLKIRNDPVNIVDYLRF
jgi:hypothetical protein